VSAFLGPIHHIMYGRIQLAAARQQDLLDFVTPRLSPGQAEALLAAWTLRHALPQGELGDLIGEAPIHGWLQRQLEAQLESEAQLWALLSDRPERLRLVAGHLRQHGLRLGEALLSEDGERAKDARRWLQAVDAALLEGMPCDHLSQVVAAGEKAYIVRRDLLAHSGHWQRAGLAEDAAIDLHGAWMAGMMEALPGARFTRNEVAVEGQRLFDDRLSLARLED
jgi:hypothetical protein